MALTSELFKNNKQLQDCSERDSAHIVANEPPLRRGVNDRGAHVALIHTALRQVMPDVSFGLEEATETYGPKTAEIVRQFKASQNPPILNKALQQKVPDNIVGKLTIAALDFQVGQKKPPTPVSPEKPNAVEKRLVAKVTFEEKRIEKPPADLDPASGGIGFAIGTALKEGVQDVLRMRKNPIEGSHFDNGKDVSRLTRAIPSVHVMTNVDINEEVRELPNLVVFGARQIRFDITRNYHYSYGVGLSSSPVRIFRVTTVITLLNGRSVVTENRTVPQPSNLLDPR